MSKEGGDLNDMAKDGTAMPNDAGKMRTIPSKPNPHQMTENTDSAAAGGLGAVGANVADNPTDISRNPKDMSSANAEAITGMGDQMPGETGSKNLHMSAGVADAKGRDKVDKHTKVADTIHDEKGLDKAKEM